jgi:predicted phosphodiesterase
MALEVQGKKSVASGMAKIASKLSPQAIISVGDIIYPDGSEGSDGRIAKYWSDIYMKHSSLKRNWYLVLGNHDWRKSSSVSHSLKFTGSSKSGGKYWNLEAYQYKKSWSASGVKVDAFFIDTMIVRGEKGSSERKNQNDWLDSKLGSSSATWKIVVGHHPPYSAGNHGKDTSVIKYIDPIMRKHKVYISFWGHDHNKQYIKYEGHHYIISGAGGQGSRSGKVGYPSGTLIQNEKNYGFSTISLCSSRAEFRHYSASGSVQKKSGKGDPWVLDKGTLGKGGWGGGSSPSPSPRRRSRSCRRRSRCSRSAATQESASQGEVEGEQTETEDSTEESEPLDEDAGEETCNGVELSSADVRCGACTVLPDVDQTTSCKEYCANHGLSYSGMGDSLRGV